jgi:catabolite regulation protein CreA
MYNYLHGAELNEQTIVVDYDCNGFQVSCEISQYEISKIGNTIEILGDDTYCCIRCQEVEKIVFEEEEKMTVYCGNYQLEISRV